MVDRPRRIARTGVPPVAREVVIVMLAAVAILALDGRAVAGFPVLHNRFTVAVKIVAFSDGVARSYWADANADVIGDRGGERRDLLKAS
jgi:hypothetical protein